MAAHLSAQLAYSLSCWCKSSHSSALAGLLCRAAEEEMLAAQLNMEAAAADREVELLQTVEERFEELLPLMEAAGEARQEAESAAKQAQEVGFRIWGASLPCHSAAA